MKKFSMRVVLIISVLFIALGSANVSIAQELDTANKLPEEELGSLDTSNIIAEEVAQEKPVEVEQLEEVPTTDELMQNPDVLEQSVADSDDPDLTVVSSGDFWTIYRNTVNNEYSLCMFGNVPSSRPTAWNSYLTRIKHIEIEEATLTGNFASYFRSNVFTVLESVMIERSNLSGVTSFESAFATSTLQKVIIRDNDYPTAPSLLTTKAMFGNANKLTELDVSGLDTSAVTNMQTMFQSCRALEELDVSHFDTSSVTTMRGMFQNCKALEKLDVSNFDTSSVTTMLSVFAECNSLEILDVSNFDTSSVTDMTAMFQNCYALEKLDTSNFDTSSVTKMYAMFSGLYEVGKLDVSHFDTSLVTTMNRMFQNCKSLKELDIGNFNTSLVTDMDRMFINCAALKSLYLDNFTTAKTMTDMFTGTTSLTYLFVSHNLSTFTGLENTSWYDEKNWVQFSNLSQLQTYHRKQSEPTGYRKGAFLSLTMDAMGGEFEDAEEQKVQSKISGEYWDEIVPVKEDYYFDGWYLDQNFTNKFDFSLPAAVSTT
ncbi:BspA family leucine-rich repeat surface protein, partial [Listeria monocytogenes]|nr:BspA family leucine-rich repeat surface protein [Listeria monocytogenes]EAF1734928.1 BspA family leucine-rich repeat surface protein [Listeria monocytogenes]EJB6139974.1 BspA family leucine-rich repeat surface protein [Listeria monocytogenes]